MDATAGIIMESGSDWKATEDAVAVLGRFGIVYEIDIVSAHRMPEDTTECRRKASEGGLYAVIAGTGGAAHLPEMLVTLTPLPVIGVPVPLRYLDGVDSSLSIVQMPTDVPVVMAPITGVQGAELLAARIASSAPMDWDARDRMATFQDGLRETAKTRGVVLRGKLGG